MTDHEMFTILMRAGWVIMGTGFKSAEDELKKSINAALFKESYEKIAYVTHKIDSPNNDQIFYVFYKPIKIADIPQLTHKEELIFDVAILKARQDLEDSQGYA